MNTVLLSLGSNIDRTKNITAALDSLNELCGRLSISSVYESEPVGFTGDCFFNLIVKIETDLSLQILTEQLKRIEDENGRMRTGPRFSSRTIDIDIVTYGSLLGSNFGIELPRPELYYNAFVLWPVAELLPNTVDTKTGQSYDDLWRVMAGNSKQKLWKVDFIWSKQYISYAEIIT
ncbi:MAG: 2-amino-4-hydroxy-6-hydroxymethyldihydropteridine diphosphokinase [Oleiphilaceae bacterium]|jgi:2-amino-4-hydroxy-6-hydroxymethyldihydropteridine diphosphokinase